MKKMRVMISDDWLISVATSSSERVYRYLQCVYANDQSYHGSWMFLVFAGWCSHCCC